MKKLLFIYLSLSLMDSTAQIFWKKNFLFGQSYVFTLTQVNSYYYIGLGNGFALLDSIGNKIQQRNFKFYAQDASSGFDGLNSMVALNSNTFVFDAHSIDICSGIARSSPGIFIVDSMGNYQNGKHYRLNAACPAIPKNISSTIGGGFIESGISFPAPASASNTRAYVILVDSALNVIWAKHFDRFKGGAQFASQILDETFIIGFNLDTLGVVLGRVDSTGSFLWCKSYFRPRGVVHALVVNNDGTSVVVGYTDSASVGLFGQYPPGFDPAMFMMKLDTAGQVLWCKSFDTPHQGGWAIESADIKKTNDGGYILTGAGEAGGGEIAVLIKTDSNGDTLWTRWHGDNRFLNYYEKVFTNIDGGYLIGGTSYGSFPHGWSSSMYLFKLDSLGHGGSCSEHSDTILTGTLTVNDSNVVLTSIDGAIALPANLIDTVYPSFAEYDHCQILNIPMQLSNIDRKMNSYPNPTTGKLTIKTEGSAKKGSTLSVYDSMGRLVIQKPYKDEKDYQLDLSKFGKGVYLIKVNDGDKTFDSKVIVQ